MCRSNAVISDALNVSIEMGMFTSSPAPASSIDPIVRDVPVIVIEFRSCSAVGLNLYEFTTQGCLCLAPMLNWLDRCGNFDGFCDKSMDRDAA